MTERGEIWRASFETPNWAFDAYGGSRNEALHALQEGWKVHAYHTKADPDYLSNYAEDVNYSLVEMACFRDGIKIWEGY